MNSKQAKGRMMLTLAILAVVSVPVSAQQSRLGEIDFYGLIGYESTGNGQLTRFPSVHFDPEHTWMFGAGGAYYFTDTVSVLADLAYGQSNFQLYDVPVPSVPSIGENVSYFNGRLNLEFTPLPAPISPVVTAGIGFNNFETAIPGASPEIYCTPGVFYWWCGHVVPTFNETAFSYNAGVGGRIDISRALFIKLMWGITWAQFGGISGTRHIDQVTLQIGTAMRYGS